MALDAVLTIFEKVGEYLVAPITGQLEYVIHYDQNIEDLKRQVVKLEDGRHRLQGSVDAARRNGEVIELDVEKWLSRVDCVIEAVRQLLEVEVPGYNRWHLDIAARYRVGKKVKDMILTVNGLSADGKFDSISHAAPPPQIFSSNLTYEAFESRIPLLKGIVGALKDEKVSTIGIYGMAGVGKKILAKEVGKQAGDIELFNTIVMVTISQSPSLKDIQGEIADMLGLKLAAESLLVRACQLRGRLLKEKQILIILDDIWSRLDLEKVGIPSGQEHNGCKIILTSRNLDACIDMDSEKNFLVEVLSDQEAWNLFKKMAGSCIEAPNLLPLAVEIANECTGLPIAIVTVARALKNRNIFVWKDALHQLKNSMPTNINAMHSKVFSSLEMSYSYLESEEAKAFFLLCCLFPEDSDIPIQELLEYGLGLGLFENFDTLEEARVRAFAVVHNLKSSCLLFEGRSKDYVKMHDVVRDVALSIASKGKHMFLVRTGEGLKRWPKIGSCEQHTAISIYSDEICELPVGLVCPKLQTLSLTCSHPLLEISGTFLEGMANLRVLHFSDMQISSLPQSFSSLTNLRTLRLDNCKLSNMSKIIQLKMLEILSLRGSDIKVLPAEIGQLIHLRLLDLTGCKNLKVIPPNVIGSLSELEELYLLDSFEEWEPVGNGNGTKEIRRASMIELMKLSRLTTLEIHIPNISLLPRDLLFKSLLSFKISLGSYFWKREFPYSKTMKLENNAGFCLESGIGMLVSKLEDFHLFKMKSLVDVIYDINREGFVNLKCLEIGSCCDLKYLVNSAEWAAPCVFPALEWLKLSDMDNMKALCNGNLLQRSFGNLRKLWLARLPGLLTLWKGSDRFLCLHNLRIVRVKNCSNLESLFNSFVANGLKQLQILDIAFCECLKEVVEKGKEGQEGGLDVVVLPQLRFLKLQHLRELTSFCPERNNLASGCDNKTTISHPLFNNNVAFPSLEEIQLKKVNKLKQIWCPQIEARSLCKLKTLRLSCCDRLLDAVPHNSIPKLLNLEQLYVGECSCLTNVFDLQGLVFEGSHCLLLSSLKKLKLQKLPLLVSVWNRNPIGTLAIENLNSLEIHKCDSLRSLFTPPMAKGFMNLQLLCVDSCEMMDEIVAEEKEELEAADDIVFEQVKHLKLLHLPNLTSFYPGNSSLSWPSLEELSLMDCPKMKAFVYGHSSTAKSNSDEQNGGSLQERKKEACCIFNEKVSFSNLNKLKIQGLQNVEIWHQQLQAESFCKLNVLVVDHCDKLKKLFTSSFIQRLQHLEQLTVSRCSSMDVTFEVNDYSENEGSALLPRLKELRLWGLPKLTIRTIYSLYQGGQHANSRESFFGRNEMVPQITSPSLEFLRIEDLYYLSEISHGQIQASIFNHLRYLAVRNCHKLQHILLFNLVRTLHNLRKLVVENCNLLEEIVAEEKGEEAADKLVFLHLATVELAGLPRVKRFCSAGSVHLECPVLNRVQLVDCPKMQTFSSGFISTPMLQKISVGKDYDFWAEDLNNTIHHLFKRNVSNQRTSIGGIEESENLQLTSSSSIAKRRRLIRVQKKRQGVTSRRT